MCGIAGKVDRRSGVSRELVESMCAAQEHRGPDSRGIHEEAGAVLGIQRLRVIDLETGDQPLYNEDGSVAVTLNGEIYNYRELRRDLEKRGHTFRSEGDTEVIAHLYEEKGADLVNEIEGMFAFALWDSRRSRLVLARDRVGKKPLYYTVDDGGLTYASELHSLMTDSSVTKRADLTSIDCYLAYGYIPAPWTVWHNVQKLPPAHTLVWEDGRVSLDRYWRLDYLPKVKDDRRELEEELRRLIGAAVNRRMVADVPLGAFLSGGVDSSIVVAEMANASSDPIETFSIGFDHESYDELPRAREIATLFGTNHHEFRLDVDATQLLPRIVRHYGEPFADSSAIPTFLLAESARQHVTVALNGDGGDESFAGYLRHVATVLGAGLDRVPARGRSLVASVGKKMAGGPEQKGRRAYLQRMLSAFDQDAASRYRYLVGIFDDGERAALLGDAARYDPGRAPGYVDSLWRESNARTSLDRVLDVEVQSYLPGDLLTKVDVATMAHSLEARSPLLDREVMEFAAKLPRRFKVNTRGKKAILRSAYRSVIPDEILDGKKMGFAIPLGQWLKGELGSYARERLSARDSELANLIDLGATRSVLEDHEAGTRDRSRQIWALLVLDSWLQAT